MFESVVILWCMSFVLGLGWANAEWKIKRLENERRDQSKSNHPSRK